jgi:hypothetical protein
MIVIAVLVPLYSACSSSRDTSISQQKNPLLQNEYELEISKKRWHESNIASYRIVVEAYQPGLYTPTKPVIIEVQDGNVTSIKPAPGAFASPLSLEPYRAYDTVERMFSLIEHWLKQPTSKVEVEYDADLGYPKRIAIDRRISAIDDELSVNVTQLEVIR